MDVMSAREAASKWGISQRRVAALCTEGRIEQAVMVGNMWIIPADAKKPNDARSTRYAGKEEKGVRPFLKWAGGKGQLLEEMRRYYPFESGVTKYAEPFVGGGAVLFDILNQYDLQQIYISDINAELINTYCVIRDNVHALTELLSRYQEEYLPLDTNRRKEYYMNKRARFNVVKLHGSHAEAVEKAALMIFLNKTCFNGLYRVNRKGQFNVPIGAYKSPLICDESNLRAVSAKLRNITIVCGDYRKSADFIDADTFVYLDPPYRPITDTSSFTACAEAGFNDAQRLEMARFADEMSQRGAKILVRNLRKSSGEVCIWN